GTDGDGLHLMNRQNGTFERLTYDALHPEKLCRPPVKKGNHIDHITFIAEDVAGKIWIGTYSEGIVCYNAKTKKIDHFNSDDKKRAKGYTDNSTWQCYVSKDGTVWISNEVNELFRVDPLQTGFSAVKMDANVALLFEDSSKNLWMTEENKGLVMVDAKTNQKKYFLHDPADPFSISSNTSIFILPRRDGKWWVGTWNGGNLFDPQTGRFTRYFYDPHIKDEDATGLVTVLETGNETYFGLTGGRMAVQNNNTGVITNYVNNPADPNSISTGPPGSLTAVAAFLDKGDGNIWISVWSKEGAALDLFNKKTRKFKHYLEKLTVGGILKSSDGKMWVGTSQGLFYRNDSLDSFIPVGPEGSEFRKTRVISMIEDGQKNIWGVTAIGIFRYNPPKNELNIYGDKFGVFGVGDLPFQPSFISSKGELFFGNRRGYYKCFPYEVINNIPSQIVLTDFKIDGHRVRPGIEGLLKGTLEDAKEIPLNYKQNIFSIDFAAIHFSDPENNIHQYMLEGYENAWRDAPGEKAAYYFNIPQGHYVFKVRAVTSYGVRSEKSIKITVLPPWWQTWWAYTLYAVLFISAVWIFIKWRTRTLKKEKIILEQKVTERTKELKDEKEIVETTLNELRSTQSQLVQSEKMASLGALTAGIAHEIQNPLNFVNNFSDVNKELLEELKDEIDKGNIEEVKAIANDVIDNEQKINHHGRRADAIVKGMLQHSKASTGEKELTDVNALANEYLQLSYHGMRAKDKNFNATLHTDFDDTISKLNIVPQDFGRVLLNLYNNAFYAVSAKASATADAVGEKAKIPETFENPRGFGQLEADSSQLDANSAPYVPTVTIVTKKLSDKIEIKVTDNGPGIPRNIIDKIFQPFFTTKPTGQGTGLGLSLSYDIIKAHGGEIKVETEEEEGSRFIIQLPVA
ncbi:MAG TPA: ATP-binding protein, partial [Parafilimonas sp.]|nr:ATP-binding protein [Parafilimonas sp.]